jgi:hypothetical protein
MKKHKLAIIIIAILILLTAVLTVVHLTTREQSAEGAVQIVQNGKTELVYLADLKPVAPVQGTVVNNAGEEKKIDGQGILVIDVLKLAGVTAENEVKVTSDDEYTVSLTAEEVAEEGKAWLLIEDGTLRLIVFGDQGAKRNVKNVVRLTVD